MAHFAQAFWSADYAGGLGILFGKLQQGVQENQQILTIARMRADAEDIYGQHMGDIGPATDKIQGGFQKDDGASTRKAYDGVRIEMAEASRKHRKIASNIRELVVYPFGRWCDQHGIRVQHSQDELQKRVKDHDRQAEKVRRFRSQYFNKCRLVEDLEEEDKLAFKEPQAEATAADRPLPPIVKVQEPESEDEPEPIEIGEQVYTPDQMKKVLSHMLGNIRLTETRVPILGTYQNVSTGADIVEYLQKNSKILSMALAEKIGQDLISNGYLRLVGSVGSTFTNSSRLFYQWRPKAFQLTGLPEKRTTGDRIGTGFSLDSLDSPLASTVNEYISNWNPLNNPHPNETPAQKLRREARESDERYKGAVRQLDKLRCALEEAMFEHLKFMERCELDRLKAIKSVVLDFSGAIGNVIPSLQSTVDNMMLFQETVQPAGDLRYFLENYRTGSFVPRVTIYENYYNSVDDQTFGVDLEARAKADRRRVPLVMTNILTYLDHQYPLLDGDEARRAIWLVDVPITATHSLRNEVNNGKPVTSEMLERFEVPIVASLFKLYLLELPDSLVSSTLYEVMKQIYSAPVTADSSNSATRVSVLQSALSQLRLANIASLDAIMTHFARLIDLTSADEVYITQLCQSLAPCILRPRTETSLNFEERYNSRFLRDLLDHKDAIFNEVKRAISLNRTMTVTSATTTLDDTQLPRAVSSDESNRRMHVEERLRAISARSRAGSPSPQAQTFKEGIGAGLVPEQQTLRNRRDSSRGPETRFPVNVAASPRHSTPGQTQPGSRGTLEVPLPDDGSPLKDHERDRDRLALRPDYNADPTAAPPPQPLFTPSYSTANGTAANDSNTASNSASLYDSPNAVTSAGSNTPSTGNYSYHQPYPASQPQPQPQPQPKMHNIPPTASTPLPSEPTSTSTTTPAQPQTSDPAEVTKQNSLGRSAAISRFPRVKPSAPTPLTPSAREPTAHAHALGMPVSERVALARQRMEKRESSGAAMSAASDRDSRASVDTTRNVNAGVGGSGGGLGAAAGGQERSESPVMSGRIGDFSATGLGGVGVGVGGYGHAMAGSWDPPTTRNDAAMRSDPVRYGNGERDGIGARYSGDAGRYSGFGERGRGGAGSFGSASAAGNGNGTGAGTGAGQEERRGVELVDRPMDD